MTNLIYMAKPIYGGWVSFTAHLALKYNYRLYKIGKRTETLKTGEPRFRKFGYGVCYQNISIEDAKKMKNILITAIDKNYYRYLSELKDSTSIVIHDPTEVKSKSSKPVLDVLSRFKVFTIRETVQDYLKTKYNIDSQFKIHPFYEYPITKSDKKGAVAISRIDFDKHTEVILRANNKLPKDKTIDIYGAKNDRYVYFKLDQDNALDFVKYYKGSFKKSFEGLDKILTSAKYVVDLSAIKNDGGGTQYTFLEAIHQNCVLILSKDWMHNNLSIFENGVNCYFIDDEDHLAKLLTTKQKNHDKILRNSKKLLKPHIDVVW